MQNLIVTDRINPVEATRALVDRQSYGFVNTQDVLGAFQNAGWKPVNTQFGRVRDVERSGFQKHLIRLENEAFPAIEGLSNDNHSKPQLVVLNSHDGTTSLQILWGVIRIACLNGIIAGTGLNGVRLVHSKSVVDKLPNGIQYMLDNFSVFQNQITALSNKTFSAAAKEEFVKRVFDARLSNVGDITKVRYEMPTLQRFQDKGEDAYTIFNRLQETLMRGGIQYEYTKPIKDDNGNVLGTKHVATHTRKLSSVASQVKLNQLAYDTALELAA